MDTFFLALLVFVPVAFLGQFFHISPLVLFVLASLAIVPLARFIGKSTEELTTYVGPGLGGILNATFGNATELIIGILALHAGLVEVVKASITGSIIGNLLLVLGTAIICGGAQHKRQTFNAVAAKSAGSQLLLATVALIMPALFLQTSLVMNSGIIFELSIILSVCLVIAYLASLLFSLGTHKHLYSEEVVKYDAKWSKTKSIIVLALATLAVSFMSDILVHSISPLVNQLGWTELFVGVVILAFIGNIAEHVSAITVALHNRMDLSLQIALGSATQVAMFVAPVLVLSSLLLKTHMSLVFNVFELAAIILAIFMVNSVIEDGESHWLEGLQLLIAYIIIAVTFFFYS